MFAVRPMFAAGYLVTPLPGGSASDVRVYPATASASLKANSDGTIVGTGNTSSFSHRWFEGDFVASDYEVRLTLVGGQPPTSGTMNTWLSLSTNRTWTMDAHNSSADGDYTMEIRHISGTPITSGLYSLYAESLP